MAKAEKKTSTKAASATSAVASDEKSKAVQTVHVAQTGAVKEVKLKAGMTVAQAIRASQLSVTNKSVRLNGQPCTDMDTVLKADDSILLVGQVAGA